MLVGILSDTHGLLRKEVCQALMGCDLLLHGGDVGNREVLEGLSQIAPLIAVQGNADEALARELEKDPPKGLPLAPSGVFSISPLPSGVTLSPQSAPLPLLQQLSIQGVGITLVHKKGDLPRLGAGQRPSPVVITGHTHRYLEKQEKDLLFLNPGSCGPRRSHQEITLMRAHFHEGRLTVQRVVLSPEEARAPLPDPGQLKKAITDILRLLKKNKSVSQISQALHLPEELVEQVVRLYLTHPGVDSEGILRKMGY